MNKHKTKFFKKVFEANSDDIMNLKDPKLHVMTQETFVPLMGQMWDKAKEKYLKKRLDETLGFAEWCINDWSYNLASLRWDSLSIFGKAKTTMELYEIWKEEK